MLRRTRMFSLAAIAISGVNRMVMAVASPAARGVKPIDEVVRTDPIGSTETSASSAWF